MAVLLYCVFLLFGISCSLQAFEKYPGMQCTGSLDDIVRDFVGTAEECQVKCSELDKCAGFVRVNSGSTYAGKCYFRGGVLSDPYQYDGDDRDCYEQVRFVKKAGMQCVGSDTDILRDFEGKPRDCAQKCLDLDECVGFIRVNSGSQYAEKCYFRAGTLGTPYQYNGDDRDCYVPVGDGPSNRVYYAKHDRMQCTGTDADILRDFEGTMPECRRKCSDLEGCVGFIRVNRGSQYAGKCYFRGGTLNDPEPYKEDNRDCFEPIFYKKYSGQQCWGKDTDILRDFVGTARECKRECSNLNGCVGFVRVNSGSQYAEKCYFRGGGLQDPYPYNNDNRDCYETVTFDKYPGEQCVGSSTDILRDFVGDAVDCQQKCAELDGCVGFVRVNSGSQYAGKCYFRGGTLNDPYPYNGDDRDCYEAVRASDIPDAVESNLSIKTLDYVDLNVNKNITIIAVGILVTLIVVKIWSFWMEKNKDERYNEIN